MQVMFIIAVLISLSINYNTSAISVSVCVDFLFFFFFCKSYFSGFFVFQVTFYWMAVIVKFTLLGALVFL